MPASPIASSGGSPPAGWESLRADGDVQFAPVTIPEVVPPEPSWLQRMLSEILDTLADLLGPLGALLGSSWWWLQWVILGLVVLFTAVLLLRLITPGFAWRSKPASADGHDRAWQPDTAASLALLEDADRLAAEGRFDEATHLLLRRSVSHLSAARPDWVEPSSTARELAALPALPETARAAFGVIAARVEASLFALRALERTDWEAARAAYAEFALARLDRQTQGQAAMNAANPAAFTRRGGFALVAGGFALFVALLYLMGSGESLNTERGTGQAHAASNGLNGYSGLVRLVEAEGYAVDRSRTGAGLETDGLLVLAPSPYADPEDIAAILANRTLRGPTLVLVSKWLAMPPTERLPAEAREQFKRGWVILGGPVTSGWTESLPQPYRFSHKLAAVTEGTGPDRWRGLGYAGTLPTTATLYAEPDGRRDVLIADGAGRTLAFAVIADGEMDGEAYPVIVVAEPDLVNNYGLADPVRAAAAMALVNEATYGGDIDRVTFDLTLNGFGASENLLTLAFRPPFLAATLSLLVALLIVGWRAFRRFGPPVSASGPAIAFGKRQLIANGAGLILRARRFRLLAKPYAALSARRLTERLGLPRPEPEAIDAALARRLPAEEPFTRRIARLETAQKPGDIVAAAKALDDLHAKLSHSQIQQGQ